jgi:hypothetical protein
MKHILVVAVAVVSLSVAIPLSKTAAVPPTHVTHKTVKILRSVAAITPVVATVAPIPQITLPNIACAQYASLFEQYNWNVHTAVAICQAESSGVASVISDPALNYDDTPDYGLMQIHAVDLLDPAQNISYAYHHKYLTQGWGAWSTYNSGAYQRYL